MQCCERYMYYSIQAERHKSHFCRRVYNGMYFYCLVLTYKASIILIDFDYGTKCHLPSTQIQKNASLQPQNPNAYTQIQMGFQSLAVCPWHFMNHSNASKTSASYSNLTEQVSMSPNGWIFYI